MVCLYVTGMILFGLHSANSLSRFPKLLLISMDGLRYDSISDYTVPNIYRWATQNTWFLRGMRPQYMSMTSTNYMGMVTGLHAESHGIVSNAFYDIDKESGSIDLSYTKEQDSGEWMNHVDEIIRLFTRTMDPANFVAWYIDDPDKTLHKHGFYDGKFIKIMAELDKVFGYLIGQMRRHRLIDKINIILAADHGHAQIGGAKNVLCIREYIDYSRVLTGHNILYPTDKALFDEVYDNLTKAVNDNKLKIKIYTKDTKMTADIIDLYSLMCFVLKIRPAPNNGSLHRIAKHIHLRRYHSWVWDHDERYEYMLLLLASLLIVAIIITICLISLWVVLAWSRSKGDRDYDEESSKSSISI
ncbi:unnamed protein product [Haemonchus placei]|uniref:Bis(5'-adenosyl)-triphosphatase n=1 Tax=Haemonchus placei TaxID=6290 RepID=A0A158QNL2_HAEPC|nr:unnamed protein product [Haemonchus placei]